MFSEDPDLEQINGETLCEMPNNQIYKFDGKIHIGDLQLSLNIDNLLLRGSVLRNSDLVLGVVIYQGHDTKIM